MTKRFMRRRAARSESGETLLEVLLTIMVVGIGMTALIAGMTIAIVSSDSHRRLGDTEVMTRDFGEAIKNAALHPVTTTLTQSVPPHMPGKTEAFTVTSVAGFPAAPFGIAIDTEEFTVTLVNTATNTMTATAGGSEGHASSANVTRYDPCPTAAQLQPAFVLPTGISSSLFGTPQMSSTVESFDPAGATVSNCAGYWDSAANAITQACALIGDHLTQCDPPLVRVGFTVSSLDADTRRLAKTSTDILIRRGNA
jgi:hypothetical protein